MKPHAGSKRVYDRDQIRRLLREGHTIPATAKALGCGETLVKTVVKAMRDAGEVRPKGRPMFLPKPPRPYVPPPKPQATTQAASVTRGAAVIVKTITGTIDGVVMGRARDCRRWAVKTARSVIEVRPERMVVVR